MRRAASGQAPPRALHVVQSLASANGGTSVSVPAIAQATASTGRYVNSVVHFDPEEGSQTDSVGIPLRRYPSSSLGLLLPTSARQHLAREIDDADVVQVHGLWTGHCLASLTLAAKRNKPVVVSAHGMLDAWALRHRRWKKAPYSMLVGRPSLNTARCFRALTGVEAANYRSYGLKGPIAVIPNGVTIPENVSSAVFLARFPHLQGQRLVLFLGRLHKKKGVHLLAEAWSAVSPQFPDAHLVIAGPDDGGLVGTSLRDGHRPGKERITLCGQLTGAVKWSALAACSVFVLPSFSEGLSMATLEALGQGVPVMITRECNFREVEQLESTFVIQPSVSSIVQGLLRVLACNSTELAARGQAGAQLIRERYSWTEVGRQMADVYDWLRGGPRPSSVALSHEETTRVTRGVTQ